jgi:hypothetical protein
MSSRKLLPFCLNRHGLLGWRVEVGVQRGIFSEHLLRYWKGELLHCVDPWKHFDSTEYVEKIDNVDDAQQEIYFAETSARLKPFSCRVRLMRATSKEAAAVFPDASLDFVYVDAQHHYSAVKEDISLWWPKLKAGGLVGGHDWQLDYGPPLYGVRKAVVEFAEQTGQEVFVSRDNDSWFIHPGGPDSSS